MRNRDDFATRMISFCFYWFCFPMRYFYSKAIKSHLSHAFFRTHGFFLSAFDIAALRDALVAFDQNLFGTRTLMGNLLFDDGDATHARAFGFGSGFAEQTLCQGGFFRCAAFGPVNHQQFADVLYQRAVQFFANGLRIGGAGFFVVGEDANFDERVRIQRTLDFSHDRFGQSGVTYHDQR